MLDFQVRLVADQVSGRTEPPDEIDIFTHALTIREGKRMGYRCTHAQRGTGHESHPAPRLYELCRWPHVEGVHDPFGTSYAAVLHADLRGDDSDTVIRERGDRSGEPTGRCDAVGIEEGNEGSRHLGATHIARAGRPLVHLTADQFHNVTRLELRDDPGYRFGVFGSIVNHDGGCAEHTADRLSQSGGIVEDGDDHRDVFTGGCPRFDNRMGKPPAHEELCMRGIDPSVTVAFQALHRIPERGSDDAQPPRAAASDEFTPTPRPAIPADVD